MQNASTFARESEFILKRVAVFVLLSGLLFMGKAAYADSFTQNNTNTTQTATTTTTYVVQSGDTLDSIAAAFNTNPTVLETLNQLSNPDLIYTGEHLLIPAQQPNVPPNAQALVCTLTAYTDGYQSTGKVPGDPGYGITSTGQVAEQGLSIAVDPSVIPYGTAVFIPGIGVRIADDTGGAIIGDHIDVFYNNQQTAMNFGVKPDVVVYLLPPSDVTYENGLPMLAQTIDTNVVGTALTVANSTAISPLVKGLPTQNTLSQPSQVSSAPNTVLPQPATLALSTPNNPLAEKQLLSFMPKGMLSIKEKPLTKSSVSATTPQIISASQNDILDVWVITLDRDVLQPVLETAKQSL